jgi:hypothetical protein
LQSVHTNTKIRIAPQAFPRNKTKPAVIFDLDYKNPNKVEEDSVTLVKSGGKISRSRTENDNIAKQHS